MVGNILAFQAYAEEQFEVAISALAIPVRRIPVREAAGAFLRSRVSAAGPERRPGLAAS